MTYSIIPKRRLLSNNFKIFKLFYRRSSSTTTYNVSPFATTSKKDMSKIFTDEGNPFALGILASCYFKEVPVTLKVVKKDFKVPGCFSEQLPIFEAEPDKYLFNANTAIRYIFATADQESNVLSNPKIDELSQWASTKLTPSVMPVLCAALSEKKENIPYESIDDVIGTLNTLLQRQDNLLGEKLSPVDVIIWASLYGVFQIKEVKELYSKYESVARWFASLSSLSSFQKATNEITQSKGIDAFKGSLEGYLALHMKSVKHSGKPESPTESQESGPSKKDIENAEIRWLQGRSDVPKPKVYSHPILPKNDEKNILITSALPYVNNVPHLGNIIGCTLSGDVYARYCRLRNYNVLYICGTDEYGTATETKAISEGVTPQQICDKYNKIHAEIYDWFNIKFDYFGRTSTNEQTRIAQDIFWKVYENGFLLEDTVDQLQCLKCDRFLADRFVEGTCPFCKYEDARGDQCDACGKLINAVELVKPRCKQCSSPPVLKTSRHIFLDLPKIEPKLREWVKKSEADNWSNNARNITKGWLAEGLKPRCITRDLKWGTPVPLEGYKEKVFYVWFDAPIGYISITAKYTDQWEKWWKNPEQVRLVQFMAKDNVPFHSVVFPSSLLAADDNYTMLNDISSTEYLNYEEDKFSKSRGVGVFGDHAKDTAIPADIFRFYLLYVRPESQDSAFQWSDLVLKNNSELLNNLGNFVNRALMFLKNNFNSTIPELKLLEEDYALIAGVNNELAAYIQHLEKLKLRDGLKLILTITRIGNQYLQGCKPWVLVKGTESEKARAGTVVGLAVNISALVAVLIKPYMPQISHQLQGQLAMPDDCLVVPDYFVPLLADGHKIGTPSPLFEKLDNSLAEEFKKKFSGKRDEKKNVAEEKNIQINSKVLSMDPADIESLEAEIAKQGNIVRIAKSQNASKEEIDAEVKKLLDLKRQMALAQGVDPNEGQKKKRTGRIKKK